MNPEIKFPPISENDLHWGLVCYSSGHASIGAKESYPPNTAFRQYIFNPRKGRIIEEYQLIYLAKGSGSFYSDATGRRKCIKVKAGDAFMLFPGQWHTYKPDQNTGWEEYWIDFVGTLPDMWIENGVVRYDSPVFHPGLHQSIIKLYQDAAAVLVSKQTAYQQILCGICTNIIGSVIYYDRNQVFVGTEVSDRIDYARALISNEFSTIRSEDVASRLGVNYAKFRQQFKDYTGITIGAYISEIKLGRAKEMLMETDKSIKEIAMDCGFMNTDYFCAVFRKNTGETATTYRNNIRGGKE